MRARRAVLIISVATFVAASLAATLLLGNALGENSCRAGWTGYVPIGSCTKAFWSAAFYIGPVVGLLAGAGAALVTDRAARRMRRGN